MISTVSDSIPVFKPLGKHLRNSMAFELVSTLLWEFLEYSRYLQAKRAIVPTDGSGINAETR